MKKVKDIGDTIRFVRLSKGVKQKELAKASGISGGYISLIETGGKNPTWDMIVKMCEALEIPITLLVMILEKDVPFVKTIAPLAYMELTKTHERADDEAKNGG